MSNVGTRTKAGRADELERMHDLYRQGGRDRQMAPHAVYAEAECPHRGCGQSMQAIDFRLEDHGRIVHDPLVRAWWDDTGFAGRCPHLRRLDPLYHPIEACDHRRGSGGIPAFAGRLAC